MDERKLSENLEIKAQVADLHAIARAAHKLTGGPTDVLLQRDTYFVCSAGRLKLREIEHEDRAAHSAELIWYERPNQTETKSSRYRITPVSDPLGLRETLTVALGLRTVVAKRRELYLYKNVRIHLDQVESLGSFVELEAVQNAATEAAAQHELVDWLLRRLGISRSDLVAVSYVDLVKPSVAEAT